MQSNQWYFVLNREIFGINAFPKPCWRWRTAAHGEVLTTDNDTPTIHLAKTQNEIGRIVANEFAHLVVNRGACDRPQLLE